MSQDKNLKSRKKIYDNEILLKVSIFLLQYLVLTYLMMIFQQKCSFKDFSAFEINGAINLREAGYENENVIILVEMIIISILYDWAETKHLVSHWLLKRYLLH